jgi:hypothetical protein
MMRSDRWLVSIAVAAFAVFALNFLYFFVDDEGIPYVYAQNLLAGRGLVYNSFEGRVEGYSDFLHVVESAAILATVRSFGLPKISVFFVGKMLSFAAGLLIVVVLFAIFRRLRISSHAAAGGAALVILTGPLAVWSCSSLETVPTALGVTVLTWALLVERDRLVLLTAVFLVLERIDGFVYAGALIAAMLAVATPDRRRALLRRVAAPLTTIFLAYHVTRFFYFGEWLPLPLKAKVLYKLLPYTQLVEKRPSEPYLLRFIHSIGWPVAIAMIAALVAVSRQEGPARAIGMATLVIGVYVSTVGDWMFGFRFFVAFLPLAAVVQARALAMMSRRWPRVSVAASLAMVVLCAIDGADFLRTYSSGQTAKSFLVHPSFSAASYFQPYYTLYARTKRRIHPGTVIADNQAGFIPFMLNVNNIDDLGICSRFYAELPTTDVIFTEVGRYQPLTPARPKRAGEAYLLYHDAQFLLVRSELLRHTNTTEPRSLLGGYFELIDTDEDGDNVVYQRTGLSAETFQTTPDAFLEDLAHVSYVKSASVDGKPIASRQMLEALPWLRNDTGSFTFRGKTSASVIFGLDDEPVYHLSIEGLRADAASTLEVALRSSNGRIVAHETLTVSARESSRLWVDLPADTRAMQLDLQIASEAAGPVNVQLTDLRALGQREPLRDYITRRLIFPRPRPPSS